MAAARRDEGSRTASGERCGHAESRLAAVGARRIAAAVALARATAIPAVAGATPAARAATEAAGWRTAAVAAKAAAARAAKATTARATLGLDLLRAGHLAAQCGAAREVDAPLRVYLDHHHGDLVTDGDDILRPVDLIVGELGGADEALLARQDLDEGAEVHQATDIARVDLADLDLFGQRAHGVHRAVHALAGDGGDVDCAVVVNVNLGAGLVLDAADG